MAAIQKKRLDVLVVEKGLAPSRQRAQAMIMAGGILVDDQPVDKPGALIFENAAIVSKGPGLPFVSRGGLKLQEALESLQMDVSGCLCLDVGASTGGFTDCLLKRGAARVYAIDVGYGQLDWRLRQDSRVVAIERSNIRYAAPETFPEPFDLITVDVSFVSFESVVPSVIRFLKPHGKILALIKPQFEVGKSQVGKGGVVKDPALHEAVIADLS
ncbi:MAG: TlyA family RNA methyltransferase, partial [Desulfobacteraceae bacterium]|nr:TlyA family RNA methyltransferase [Desulfobacteraceae bacterium]